MSLQNIKGAIILLQLYVQAKMQLTSSINTRLALQHAHMEMIVGFPKILEGKYKIKIEGPQKSNFKAIYVCKQGLYSINDLRYKERVLNK